MALLLLLLPSVLTSLKLFVFVALTERSHQLQAVPSELALLCVYCFCASGFLCQPFQRLLSLSATARSFLSASFPAVVHLWKTAL